MPVLTSLSEDVCNQIHDKKTVHKRPSADCRPLTAADAQSARQTSAAATPPRPRAVKVPTLPWVSCPPSRFTAAVSDQDLALLPPQALTVAPPPLLVFPSTDCPSNIKECSNQILCPVMRVLSKGMPDVVPCVKIPMQEFPDFQLVQSVRNQAV